MKRALIVAVASVLTGCSLDDRIEMVSDRIQSDYEKTLVWDELPRRTISWQQALAMMKKQNSDVLNIENSIRSAAREAISVYTDMIPGLSYYGYLTRSIDALSDAVSAEDLSSRVNVTFSIPTLTQVPYRVYAAKAREFAARKAKEGKIRELESRLYKAVRLREINQKLREMSESDPEAKQDVRALQSDVKDEKSYWSEVAEIVGNYEARWVVLPESVPHVRWEDYRPRLDKLDPLVVCRFALELEQSRLAQYGVVLRYLPTINTSLYSPSLFTSSGGTYEGTFLDGEETRINLSISYNLDTKLDVWKQYEDSKARYEAAKRKVVVELIKHKNNVHRLRDSVDEYRQWRSYMHKRIDFVREMPAESSTSFLEREKALRDMKRELLIQEQNAVESEAAIVLEYGMPRH